MITFEPFPKLARLSRGCVITEKLDGTNAQVYIQMRGEINDSTLGYLGAVAEVEGHIIYAGSRTRWIKPGKLTDNYGFAAWVYENAAELVKLGPGQHFGEWYGQGIQRGYGLTEKRFALFNAQRWAHAPKPSCVSVVPVLHEGAFETDAIATVMEALALDGSHAVPGFMTPEGVVIYHAAARCSFKKTFDDGHKESA
jgi:hypothetical protein